MTSAEYLGAGAAATVAGCVLPATLTAAMARSVLARLPNGATLPAGPVEAVTAACVMVVAARYVTGALPGEWLPVVVPLTVLAVPLALVDLRERRLPDPLTLAACAAIGCGIGYAAVASGQPELLAGAAAGACLYGGAHLVVHLARPRSLGAGDVKLAVSLGAVLGALGPSALLLAGVLAPLVTVVLALVTVVSGAVTAPRPAPRSYRGRWPGDGIPHGPGLLLATWVLAIAPSEGLLR
ncbi:prepilin peptidase [Haloechinothrix sp. LS1_15]|uniref:prepilin peptidase n=1 Tax=Haloechinothrix sp. LS1_15 TaxID=2652248 RepID=UPI002947D42E|nr:prepilin peptidase [Haloechinothrix sp. LS1_15]MDV6013285.1 prepilin peptidase [Haloechinothrix sp. LS1_15]